MIYFCHTWGCPKYGKPQAAAPFCHHCSAVNKLNPPNKTPHGAERKVG